MYESKEKNKRAFSTIRSFYLGHQELGILNEKGMIKKLRVPGISGNTISLKSVAIEIDRQPYEVLHDISGNVIALLDPESRDVMESYIYSAFGEEKIYDAHQKQISSSAIGNHWRYAEKPIDEETGLIYFGFRYYDPSAGRWISKDPAGFVDGPNLYAYCHNNPLTCSDPFGLATVDNDYFYGDVEKHCYCERHRTCKRGGDLDKTAGSSRPRVLYCESFERIVGHIGFNANFLSKDFLRPLFDSSGIYETKGWDLADLGIGFTNGILNDFYTARESARYLSRLAGGYNIHYVYNASHGLLGDSIEYVSGRNFIATDPVRLIHQMWNSFFETRSASAKFLMFCHSQGAVNVRNALLDYPPELRNRIAVVAIAPGGYIYHDTCAQVTHYRNASLIRDIVPRLDWKGAERESMTIVELASHPQAIFFDHSFQSLTFRRILIDKLDEFK